jgi:hypothetical protein
LISIGNAFSKISFAIQEVIGESAAERELTERVLELETRSRITENSFSSSLTPFTATKNRPEGSFRISFINLKENTQKISKYRKNKKKDVVSSESYNTSDESTSSSQS